MSWQKSIPVKEVPHLDWSKGTVSETKGGAVWVRTIYEALAQFVQVTLAGRELGLTPKINGMRVLTVRVPITFCMLVSVWVTQLTLELRLG